MRENTQHTMMRHLALDKINIGFCTCQLSSAAPLPASLFLVLPPPQSHTLAPGRLGEDAMATNDSCTRISS